MNVNIWKRYGGILIMLMKFCIQVNGFWTTGTSGSYRAGADRIKCSNSSNIVVWYIISKGWWVQLNSILFKAIRPFRSQNGNLKGHFLLFFPFFFKYKNLDYSLFHYLFVELTPWTWWSSFVLCTTFHL